MTLRLFGGLLLCVLVLGGPAAALDPARPVNEYGFQSWGSREGLPQNTINSIAQTRDGYLWIATRSGLVRLDGCPGPRDMRRHAAAPHARLRGLRVPRTGTAPDLIERGDLVVRRREVARDGLVRDQPPPRPAGSRPSPSARPSTA